MLFRSWGYYDTYEGSGESDQKEFSVGPDDVRFEELLRLFRETKFRTKLTNLIPMYGMQYHTKREGDFQWTVWLRLENVVFPNGDTGTGDMLRFYHISRKIASPRKATASASRSPAQPSARRPDF